MERKNKEKTSLPILDKLELLFYYNIISHLNNLLIPEVRAWQSALLDPSQGRMSLRMQRSEMKQSAFIDLDNRLWTGFSVGSRRLPRSVALRSQRRARFDRAGLRPQGDL